ncbi:hypothetical protein BH20ACI1_BH20ACI1_12310 [soil metagenome]
MKNFQEKVCPQCGMPKLKTWEELSGEQKFLAERLPLSADFSTEERKKHLFCTNCWNEIYGKQIENC